MDDEIEKKNTKFDFFFLKKKVIKKLKDQSEN
jgi:hypothetical protein